MTMRTLASSILVGLVVLSTAAGARAAPPPPPPPAPPQAAPSPDVADAKTLEARKAFVAGNDLAKTSQWAQALAAFERSSELRPHPLTTFNMAVCERALGRLTRARVLFAKSITTSHDVADFPESRLEEARGYAATIEAELVRLDVKLAPRDAALSVDSRGLEIDGAAAPPIATAGLGKPGGTDVVPGKGSFTLVVDPGTHFFRVVAKGYADVSVTKTFAPGTHTKLDLELDRLPATFRISSNVEKPIVTIDGADVGLAPVAISRPAGTYRIVVRKEGFDTFDTKVAVLAGQDVDMPARMAEEKIPLTKRWWFWTAIGTALAGGAVLTYALTRETPSPPPYSGGTTGWVATPK